jgi:DNA-binding NtrC family response regulator
MERHVLFIGFDDPFFQEIREFMKDSGGHSFDAHDGISAVRVLDQSPIDTVVINMKDILNVAILEYVNQNYPDITVLISTSEEIGNLINILNNGHFQKVNQPLKLKDLTPFI